MTTVLTNLRLIDGITPEPQEGLALIVDGGLEHMQAGGLTGQDLIHAATAGPARWLGDEDRYGMLRPGLAADLIVTREDPTADISALRTMDFVMKAGVVVRDDRGLARIGR